MDYTLSKEAHLDLEEIWLFTLENWSIEQADRYISLIFDEIIFLSKNPKSRKDYSFLRKGYFRAEVKSHFIFYKIGENLEVIRALDQRMDIENRLI